MTHESDEILAALHAGKAEFMGHDFLVESGVLVPRPVTEVLVRACRTLMPTGKQYTFVDLGCGSGMIGIMLAIYFSESTVVCLDISEAAVQLTHRNIDKYGLCERVTALHSDLFGAIPNLVGQADAVVSSPPFISTSRLAKERAHLLDLEPRAAFDAGPYGISLHQRLVKDSKSLLRPGSGWIVLEFGEGQHNQVRRLLERAGGYEGITEFKEHTDTFVACLAARFNDVGSA